MFRSSQMQGREIRGMMQRNSLLIRRAEACDAACIADIEKQCFSSPWSEASVISTMENQDSAFFVAEVEGKTVGYIGSYFVLDEGNVTNVAVLPGFRRNGIAFALIEALKECAEEKKLAFLTLEVRASNPARRLYEKLGFSEVGVRKNYYSNPTEDAVLMTLFFERNR